jgi:hypothetical protein
MLGLAGSSRIGSRRGGVARPDADGAASDDTDSLGAAFGSAPGIAGADSTTVVSVGADSLVLLGVSEAATDPAAMASNTVASSCFTDGCSG